MYALMQSTGMVDDHVEGCHRTLALDVAKPHNGEVRTERMSDGRRIR
jgi:DNA-3-methyladenine glycosylase I